jgi:hypothetical protein
MKKKKENCHKLNLLLLIGASTFGLPQDPTTINPALKLQHGKKIRVLTGKSTPVPFLSIMATIATDKSTRSEYATARHKNMSSICKCLTPNSWAATSQHFKYFLLAHNRPASQNITCSLWRPKHHNRVHKSLLLVPIMNWIQPHHFNFRFSFPHLILNVQTYSSSLL